MTAKVKICGLTREHDIEAAIASGADMLGFIVHAKSPRSLSIREAARLSLPAKGIIPRVAVTVTEMEPDYIQFHGDEPPELLARVSRYYDVKTIKALPVSSKNDIIAAMAFSGFADLILFDAKPPSGSDIRGGHGMTFDWNILKGAALPKNWLLAGGLNPDNAREALNSGAPILDVSSGVESAPGVKDHQTLAAFIQKAKSTYKNKS